MLLVFVLVAFLLWPNAAHAMPVTATQSPVVNINSLIDIEPNTKVELDEFYAQRAYHTVWDLTNEEAIKKAQNFIDSIEGLALYHGLDKGSYRLEEMRKLTTSAAENDRQRLEFLITASLLHLAHDLHGDSVDLNSLYPGWDLHRKEADFALLLNTAVLNGTLGAFFQQIAPQNQSYRSLAGALQTYNAIEAKGNWPTIASGTSLQLQDHGERVTQLRARLAAEGYVATPDNGRDDFFDDDLNQALITYQTQNGLTPDGHAGEKTQESLNTTLAARIAQIRANMERWRHIPEDFPTDRYVMVNIPDFTVSIHENGTEVYKGHVVDGRTDRPTPFIDSQIYNMVINPSWHVPLTIARKDILPKLRKDQFYLQKLGAVIDGRDNDPAGTTINWKNITPNHFYYQIRQVPGDLNSLGPIKFNFRNPFDVYMHGTPHQELFKKAERDFSSGCVRLEEPLRVGEALMANNEDKGGWSQQRISDEIDAEATHTVPLAKPIPVYFLYWSVFPGDDGRINFRNDIYGYDSLLMNKIKNKNLQLTAR